MYEKDKTLDGEVHSRTAPDKTEGDKIVQTIVFNLEQEEFGADIDQVREIISKGFITPIPDSPDFISGMTNVRGEIAVVIDLKNRFLLSSKSGTDEKHIIITEHDKNLFGLMVDEVTEVLRIQTSEIKATPEIVTRIDRVYIKGIITLGKRLIMLLDGTRDLKALTRVMRDEGAGAEGRLTANLERLADLGLLLA